MDALNSLINLSSAVAIAPQLTQGGGGNTSVKEGDTMWIKASGFRLDEVSEQGGFVKVQYQPVVDFLKKDTNTLQQPDAELKQLVNEQIIGDKTFLPSMETGFHAVLKRYIIHTHPVEVNQLLCCQSGELTIRNIFKDQPIYIIPSVNPGYYLSKAIADIKDIPDIIFLQNHGLIVHSDSEAEAITLHKHVIQTLNNALTSNNNYAFRLEPISEQVYLFESDVLGIYFSQQSLLSSTYFPDQAVVIGQNYQYTNDGSNSAKLNFNTATQQCTIKAAHKSAMAIAENLVALGNIVAYAQKEQLQMQALPDADVAYILGMDMEKYRQGLLK